MAKVEKKLVTEDWRTSTTSHGVPCPSNGESPHCCVHCQQWGQAMLHLLNTGLQLLLVMKSLTNPDASYNHLSFTNTSQAFVKLFQMQGLDKWVICDKINGLEDEKRRSSIFDPNTCLSSMQSLLSSFYIKEKRSRMQTCSLPQSIIMLVENKTFQIKTSRKQWSKR